MCYLFDNSDEYRVHWGGEPQGKSLAKLTPQTVVVIEGTGEVEKKPEIQYPSLAEQAANLTKEIAEWIAAGRPTRTDEECDRIHKICEECPSGFYDKEQDRCKACGCGLGRDSSVAWVKLIGIPDAIRMATKKCPKGHWQ